ncbi:MAG: glycosyltransferase family 39 protein [bacterium]
MGKILLLIAFISIYYSGFTNFFVGGDDIWLYMSAPGGWDRVVALFADIGGTYRPIPFSLFSLYHLFSSNITLMHWVPIILHAINIVLVYLLAKQFSKSRLGAIVAAIMYGVSHIVFFDVFNLTGLVDQLFLLFGLGAIYTFNQKPRLSWLLFILAMFSKESFVSVLLVISYFLWKKRAKWKSWMWYWLPTVMYFAGKLLLYRQQGEAYSYGINLATLANNLFDYGLWLINWRHGWQMGMPYPPHPLYDLVSVVYALLLGLAIWQVWKNKRKLFWSMLWWGVVGLLPFYFLGRALPFYLEFSLVGVAIMVGAGVRKRWWLGAMIMGLSIYMSMTTKAQWVENSFSARGVQAAEQFREQVVDKYDWNQYNTLCLTGMGEYELWSTGVAQELNLVQNETINIYINSEVSDKDCDRMNSVKIQFESGNYLE